MTDRRHTEKGFTLIELLIAMTIFAIGLLAIAGMQITAMQGNTRANTLTAATALAEGVMEEILAWDIEKPELNAAGTYNWDFDPATVGTQNTRTLTGAGTYAATYVVVLDYGGVTNLTQVTVTVTGVDPNNTGRTVTLVGFKRLV